MFFCEQCKNMYEITVDKSAKLALFKCNGCNLSKDIPKETLIYSKHENKSDIVDYNPDLIYDDTLPNTRMYMCPNTDCTSHKNKDQKEAVFYRDVNSYGVKYICKACKMIIA